MATLGTLEYLISVNSSGVKSGIDKAEREVKSSGDRVGRELDNVGSKISAWTIAKGQMIAHFAERAMQTTANMVKQTVKSAVDAYAQYEQLVGGVETLYGDAADTVVKNASKAFKTAGVSANQYMEQVTSFAASLKQSLGGDVAKAAEIADMAIIDIADNSNKMGTAMESIQHAYQGFAKQNYTMLDNLKLGYGGTKTEMERLLADAEKLSGVKYDIKNLSDVYEAIHVIQTELGITGTTKAEAEGTISGAMNSAKAAWQDLLVALGSGKDVKKATTNFGRTLATTVKNIRPVALNAIHGIFESAKVLFPELKALFKETFTAVKLQVADWLDLGSDASWFDIGKRILVKVKSGAKTKLIDLFGLTDSNGNPLDKSNTWGEVGESISKKLSESLSDGGWLNTALDNAAQNLTTITKIASQLITEIAKWLSDSKNMQIITDAIVGITNALVGVISSPEFQSAITELANSLVEAIKKLLPSLLDAAKNIWQGLNTESKVVVGGLLINNLLKGLGQGGILATIGKTLPKALPLLGTAGKAILGSAAGAPLIGSIASAGLFYAIAKGASANNYIYRGKYDPTRYSDREDAANIQTAVRGLLGSSTSNGKWQFGYLASAAKTAEEFIGLFDYMDEKGGSKNWLMSELGAGDEMKQAAIAEIMATAFGKGSWRNLPIEQQRLLESGYDEYTKQGGRNIDYTSLMAGAQKFFENHGVFDEKGLWTIPITPEVPSDAKENIESELSPVTVTPQLPNNVKSDLESKISPLNATVSLTLDESGISLSFGGFHQAKGDWNVPYDNYPSLLHRGEMVLTASQARKYREGEMNADYGIIGEMIGTAINQSMKKVYVMMSGEKVGDLTTKRVRKNINASSYSKTRAMGG